MKVKRGRHSFHWIHFWTITSLFAVCDAYLVGTQRLWTPCTARGKWCASTCQWVIMGQAMSSWYQNTLVCYLKKFVSTSLIIWTSSHFKEQIHIVTSLLRVNIIKSMTRKTGKINIPFWSRVLKLQAQHPHEATSLKDCPVRLSWADVFISKLATMPSGQLVWSQECGWDKGFIIGQIYFALSFPQWRKEILTPNCFMAN